MAQENEPTLAEAQVTEIVNFERRSHSAEQADYTLRKICECTRLASFHSHGIAPTLHEMDKIKFLVGLQTDYLPGSARNEPSVKDIR
jgi:hypothetical protein